MQLRKLGFAAGVALSVALLPVTTRAQQVPDSSRTEAQRVRTHLDAADRAYSEGRYSDAVTNFVAADRLQPSPAIQLALGKTFEQMNDPSRALASYREYFVRSPHAADRSQVQARVTVLAAQLAEKGVQQISVSSVPAGATVLIDTKALGLTPIYIDLSPGSHHLEFHRDGYEPAGLDFELSPQQPLNVMTTLVPAKGAAGATKSTPAAEPPAPAPVPAPAAALAPEAVAAQKAAEPTAAEASPAVHARTTHKADETTIYMRTFGFAALGGSVVTLGTAVAFELMRSQSESRARQQHQQIAFKDALDTMHTQQTIARVFAVSAGVLAATGGVLLVLAAQHERSESSAEGAAVACAPTGCSAVYQGRF